MCIFFLLRARADARLQGDLVPLKTLRGRHSVEIVGESERWGGAGEGEREKEVRGDGVDGRGRGERSAWWRAQEHKRE